MTDGRFIVFYGIKSSLCVNEWMDWQISIPHRQEVRITSSSSSSSGRRLMAGAILCVESIWLPCGERLQVGSYIVLMSVRVPLKASSQVGRDRLLTEMSADKRTTNIQWHPTQNPLNCTLTLMSYHILCCTVSYKLISFGDVVPCCTGKEIPGKIDRSMAGGKGGEKVICEDVGSAWML